MYLVIFDCDGTLIDSQNTIVSGMDVAFRSQGLTPPDRARCLSIVGLSLEVAIRTLCTPEDAHLAGVMADAYRDAKVAEREAGGAFDPLYPGAKEAVDLLHARDDVLLGVATGKAYRGVVHMVEMHGLHDRFVTIQTADRAPSKPHPGMILQALEETGAEAARTVMIGDTSYDMEMARSAGVSALGVSWGYHARPLLEGAGAHAIIDNFSELAPELTRRFGWIQDVRA
ncbi:HAD-IA family hydrolase [Breoghania sp. L-A4]|uniref:HAD-IA family hydrolase n=1 Tax=Breoghania sp. L-A4 TaxID=2304600 RepID=UPI000E35AC85|nr:HAD-IA family hydrolase [Breoghania sp. L-A4]AXS40859.1 HAD family hydrolase [Breoghania sp. L-A4]